MIEALYTLTIAELFLGGGGRLMPVGPVTVRMILFAACMASALFVVRGVRHRVEGFALSLALLAGYLLTHVPAFLIGLLHGASLEDVFTDIQASMYWFIVPFFALALSNPRMVLRSAFLAKAAGVLLSLAYMLILVGLATGVLNFFELYETFDVYKEFVFRGESSFFLYKGFLYLGISSMFFIATQGRWHNALLLIVLTALVLSLTRGYVLATSVAALAMLVQLRRWRAVAFALAVCAVAGFLVWSYLPSLDEGFLTARSESNVTRSTDIAFMIYNSTPLTLLFGEGFGSYINGRLGVENTFLYLWWKTGIFGLMFWMVPLVLCFRYYRRIPQGTAAHRLATAFFYSVLLIYVQTATNPYLNNAIGLSFVLISMFSLRQIAGHLTLPKTRAVTAAAVSLQPAQ